MPGRGSYGSGGKWIYTRAKHLRSRNPKMTERLSFALATQQVHKVDKSPKSFRTEEGMDNAQTKYQGPVEAYKKTAEAKKEPFYKKPPHPAFGALAGAAGGYGGSSLAGASMKKRLLSSVLGAAALGGLTSLPWKKHRSGKKKTAMIQGLFDELEKISQASATPMLDMPAPPTPSPTGGVGQRLPGNPSPNALGGTTAPTPQPAPLPRAAASSATPAEVGGGT